MAPPKDKLICVAAIAGAFGVKGEVKLKPFTERPESCALYGPLFNEDGAVVLTPRAHRLVKNAVAVTAPEVTAREQAEALKSVQLYIPRSALPETEEDDFYHSDLIGLDVKTVDGKRMGKIIAVQAFGAGDMLEIKPKEGASFFHPFTKIAVPKVDLKAGRVIIHIEPAEIAKEDAREETQDNSAKT